MTPPLMRLGSVMTPGTFAMGAPPHDGGLIIAIPPAHAIAPSQRRPATKAEADVHRRDEPDRRKMLTIMAGITAGAVVDAAPAAAQVKWSGGSERPRLKAPPNACDCHHFIYDSRYPADRRGIPFPGAALAA